MSMLFGRRDGAVLDRAPPARIDLDQTAAVRGQPEVAIGVFVNSLRAAELRGRRLAVFERIEREPSRMAIPGGQSVAGRVNDPQHARVVLERFD